MKRLGLMIVLLRALGCAGVLIMGVWARMSGPHLALLATPCAVLCLASATRREGRWKAALAVVWGCTLLGVGCILFARNGGAGFDPYHAVMMWLVAVTLFSVRQAIPRDRPKTAWTLVAMLWGFGGGFLWLAAAYLNNSGSLFRIGLLINVLLLILCHLLFRMPVVLRQIITTLILLLVGLPVADLFVRSHHRPDLHPDPAKRYYLYEVAAQDTRGYEAWHEYVMDQWRLLTETFFIRDPAGVLPLRLRPKTRGLFFNSPLAINRLGFRGNEIEREKGNAYRIIALGESSTFGATMMPTDRPWPELLEAMIRDRLKPRRPVEVINAGVPGYTLEDNLHRLAADILPLKPDMIISYHGANGFPLILSAMPDIRVKNPPVYRERPLRLLADCEFNLKVLDFKRRQTARLTRHPSAGPAPLETEYARAYRQLIHIAHTNGIVLVVGNFSMAVNQRSDPKVIDFYRGATLAVHWQIIANHVHSTLIRQLAEQYPEIRFVDTQPHLDGEHDKFTDLVHLTQEGRQQLAETFFAGITNVLSEL